MLRGNVRGDDRPLGGSKLLSCSFANFREKKFTKIKCARVLTADGCVPEIFLIKLRVFRNLDFLGAIFGGGTAQTSDRIFRPPETTVPDGLMFYP